MRRLDGSSGRSAAILWVLTIVALSPSVAVAQQRDAAPSATELWREYPLEATPEARARPTSQPASRPAAGRVTPSRRRADAGGPGALTLIAAAILAAGGLVLALGWIGWRARRAALRPRPAASTEASGTNGDAPAPVPARGSRVRRAAGRPRGGEPATRSAAPPDVAVEWTAEIQWHHLPGGSRFCMIAGRGSQRAVVSESEPLEWPPTGPDSLRALRQAVEQLESRAVAAGWRPAPAGRAWYAKRFSWHPARVARASPAHAASPLAADDAQPPRAEGGGP